MEEALRDDLPAARAAFRAFNRWLDDDWGFHYKERIFAAPYLTLSDVDETVAELEWVLDRGARIVIFQYGPGAHARGLQVARRSGVRSDLGAHRGGGHRRRLPRRRQRLQLDPRHVGRRWRGRGVPIPRDARRDVGHADRRHARRGDPARRAEAFPEAEAGRGGDRLRVGGAAARAARQGLQAAAEGVRRGPARCSSATCGSPRSTRTTSTSSVSSSAPTTCSWDPTGRTPRGSSSRCRSCRICRAPGSRDDDIQKICHDNTAALMAPAG